MTATATRPTPTVRETALGRALAQAHHDNTTLQHQLDDIRARLAIADDHTRRARQLEHANADLRRRIAAALGQIQRFDACDSAGYVAVLLVDLALTLGASRDGEAH